EALIGLTVVTVVCILSSATVAARSQPWRRSEVTGSVGARGPPSLTIGFSCWSLLAARCLSRLQHTSLKPRIGARHTPPIRWDRQRTGRPPAPDQQDARDLSSVPGAVRHPRRRSLHESICGGPRGLWPCVLRSGTTSAHQRGGLIMIRMRGARLLFSTVGIAVGGLLLAGGPAHAKGLVVPRDYPTIQAAVDAAAPGATITVRRGTYTEQIVLAKDGILPGEGAGTTIIKAPATLTPYAVDAFSGIPVGAIVRSTDGANVRMSGFTVTGPTPCFAVSGVVAVKASTLHLSDAHVTLIYPEDLDCPIAFRSSGVVIGLPAFIVIDGEADGGSIAHGTVSGVVIDQYLTTGVAVLGPFDGPPSTATITDNVMTGGVPFATPGQAGVTVSFASVARVTGNTINDTVCTAPGCGRDPINEFQSVGIGGNSNPPGTVIEGNTVSGSD